MNKLNYCWALVLIGFLACTDTDPKITELNQTINIGVSELVTFEIPLDDKYIDLAVLEITESRCPSDVTCIRFGEARVNVGVNGTDKVIKTLDMCIGDCPERQAFMVADTLEVEINDRDYQVILSGVAPYPTSSNGIIPKQALIKIIEL